MATKKKAKAAPTKAKKAAPQKAAKAQSVKKKAASKKEAPVANKKKAAAKGNSTVGAKNKIASKKVFRTDKTKATEKKELQSGRQKQAGVKKSGILAKAKNKASDLATKALHAVAKVITKKKSKQAKEFKPKTPVITHGEDMHLIPVQGEIHPARRDEASLLEKQFRHNQQIAWQREQQLMRQVQSQTAARKVFRTPRHS